MSGRGHAISLVGAGIAHIVLHTGPWKNLAGYGPPSSFLLSQHPRVSSHLQRPTSATSYSPWGRAGRERPQAPIASDVTPALGVPLLESKGKAGRKERPQEINKCNREPRHALECGLNPEDMKTQVMLLLASRESKANDLETRGEGSFNFTYKLNPISESKHC